MSNSDRVQKGCFTGLMALTIPASICVHATLDGLLSAAAAGESARAIPLLGQLPILGELFRNANSQKSVCLMITPNLMR